MGSGETGHPHPRDRLFRDRLVQCSPPKHPSGIGTPPLPALEAGLGYAASSTVRLEIVGEYRPHFEFEGMANFLAPGPRQSVAADASSLSGMVAAYIDMADP